VIEALTITPAPMWICARDVEASFVTFTALLLIWRVLSFIVEGRSDTGLRSPSVLALDSEDFGYKSYLLLTRPIGIARNW
jgi:hypothetical protein